MKQQQALETLNKFILSEEFTRLPEDVKLAIARLCIDQIDRNVAVWTDETLARLNL